MKRARKVARRALACLLSAALMVNYSSIAYAVDYEGADAATEESEVAATSDPEETIVESTSEETSDAEAAKVVLNSDDDETEEEQEEPEEDQSGEDDGSGGESGGTEDETPSSTAKTEVSYIDASGNTTQTDASISVTVVDGNTTSWSDGWYVVDSIVEITSRITVSGEVHLILADNATLTASRGISVNESNSLTIYAQSTDETTMGSLIATGARHYAGIGSDSNGSGTAYSSGAITINGGNITATGGYCAAGIGGGNGYSSDGGNGKNITINGGIVTATGGNYAAGIGGGNGNQGTGGNGENIIINGGTVKASGGSGSGAGIGGGYTGDGINITINNGVVTAQGTYRGAGIGGGRSGSAYNIIINDGEVTANGGYAGTGIGAGRNGNAYSINITGGTVTATGRYGAAGIGVGRYGSADGITISGGTVIAYGGYDAAGIGGGYCGSATYGSVTNITISGGIVTATGSNHAAGIGGGHYSTASNIKITGGIVTASGVNQAIGNGYSSSQVSSVINYSSGGFYYRASTSDIFTYEANTDFTATTTYLQIYPALDSSFESSSMTVYVGDTLDLAEYFKSDYEFNGYTWESDDTSCVTVDDDGNIKAVSAGSATVTVTAVADGEGVTSASIEINVIKYDSTISFDEGFSLNKPYDGDAVSISESDVETNGSSGEVSFAWYASDGSGGWEPLSEAPTDAGSYKVVATLAGDDTYSSASAELEFSISQATPTASDFTFAVPNDLTYDANEKEASVSVAEGISGMGEITSVEYSSDGDTWSSTAPTDAGTYLVRITVAEGGNYTEATVSDENWTFDITQAANSWTTEPDIDGWVYGDSPSEPVGKAAFGDIEFTYSDSSTAEGGWSSELPTTVGTWYMRASVEGTDNYTGLETVISFEIYQAPLSSIEITSDPANTAYYVGESFDTTGMVVTAIYSDETSKVVEDYTYEPEGALSLLGTQVITISYTEGDVTATATVEITVTYRDMPNDWSNEYIIRASQLGLMSGYTDEDGNLTGYFGPYDELTRAQAITVIYRAMTGAESDEDWSTNSTPFTDVAESEFYTAALNWAYENNLVTGDQNLDTGDYLNTFRPNDTISRQELAIMVWRAAGSPTGASDAAYKETEDCGSEISTATEALIWAAANGILTGWEVLDDEGNVLERWLNPYDDVTRQQAAKVFVESYEFLKQSAASDIG